MTVITSPERTEEFLRALGDPAMAVVEIQQAQASGRVLSSEQSHLIDQYPDQWVALHNGEVVAASDSLDELLAEVDPATRSHVLVRFITRHELKMIL